MNGIFHWFKDSSKMKRWIMLILVGIVFASFGMANMIVSSNAITFLQAAKIIVYFVIGFTCVVIGLVFINKRTMELFIEATDDRIDSDEKVNVNSLFIDIVGSSDMTDVHKRPTLAKIYRCFISECTAIMNDAALGDLCKEINIHGDCV